MRHIRLITGIALVAVTLLSSCRADDPSAANAPSAAPGGGAPALQPPSGSPIEVTLASRLTSETAGVGDSWSGSVRSPLIVNGRTVVPAGSSVSGTVTAARPARKGDRAMLDLGLTSINVAGRNYLVDGRTEAVVAGSTRARNLGAIGAATVAGAVVGHAVGGSTKGTIVGGLIGGGAATGVVSQTSGWQVVLKEGTALTFTTSDAVAIRTQ